ncbi:MAG: hypothetical protein KAS76_00555 [Thermoplasmatales archaeon]|nr:hypothetical protein [Thermoplasmatales archaeon]MCK4995778.1 hypothetical protein [Thermoplasmatales archaeon]MCK5635793.1 hypothetical protein [Thermoplasmatales archaeon]
MGFFDNIEGASEWIGNLSLEEILKGNLSGFTSLFYLIIMIAIYAVIIYHFYRYIARRDCFKPSERRHTKTIGFLKYTFLFPFVAILFFMGFSLMFVFLTKTNNLEPILTTAFAIIVAIRITAYYTEDLSKDVAKMLPFAILGIFLVDPAYYTIDHAINRINQMPQHANVIIQFILLIILVEWILRVALTIRYTIIPKKEERFKI